MHSLSCCYSVTRDTGRTTSKEMFVSEASPCLKTFLLRAEWRWCDRLNSPSALLNPQQHKKRTSALMFLHWDLTSQWHFVLSQLERLSCPLMYILGEDDLNASSKENSDVVVCHILFLFSFFFSNMTNYWWWKLIIKYSWINILWQCFVRYNLFLPFWVNAFRWSILFHV